MVNLKTIYIQQLILLILVLSFSGQSAFSQTLLEANSPGNTYELINSILAPGYDAVEEPDCNHKNFGRHIDEVFDTVLNKHVFRFYIHTSPDNDRCLSFDRQRNEIKTYDQSPDNLLGIKNEKVEYKWKFKLGVNFQPSKSFTHLHQLKAKGGFEERMPLITLTARKKSSSPDKLELRYAESLVQTNLKTVDLSPFKGAWVEVTETIVYGEIDIGEYSIVIKKLNDGKILLNYFNDSIRTWKTDALFIRPKWGIYRSLNDAINLQDEQVLFADFIITELRTNNTNTVFTDGFENTPSKLIAY